MNEQGKPIYACMYDGKHTTEKFRIQGMRLPFCNWKCLNAWAKRERAEKQGHVRIRKGRA